MQSVNVSQWRSMRA